MPRRDDIRKILIIGSGPIIIGQACEFDYSGTQACKALKKLGYEIVLVNSNPATIMTDPEFADRTYVEPLLPGPVARVIDRERPDALLPTLGGQTALNLAKALHDDGTLERFGVDLAVAVSQMTFEINGSTFSYGIVIDAVIYFVSVAAVVFFFIVKPVEAIDAAQPDYILILPWNLKQEIVAQMHHVGAWGGKFIVPIPEIAIIDPGEAIR